MCVNKAGLLKTAAAAQRNLIILQVEHDDDEYTEKHRFGGAVWRSRQSLSLSTTQRKVGVIVHLCIYAIRADSCDYTAFGA